MYLCTCVPVQLREAAVTTVPKDSFLSFTNNLMGDNLNEGLNKRIDLKKCGVMP